MTSARHTGAQYQLTADPRVARTHCHDHIATTPARTIASAQIHAAARTVTRGRARAQYYQPTHTASASTRSAHKQVSAASSSSLTRRDRHFASSRSRGGGCGARSESQTSADPSVARTYNDLDIAAWTADTRASAEEESAARSRRRSPRIQGHTA